MEKNDNKTKLDQAIGMLLELGKGNFNVKVDIDAEDDLQNTILAGLNMLAEELLYYRNQLNAKSALLENTLHNISEVVYVLNVQGNDLDSARFDFVSPRVKEIFGYDEKEIYDDASIWYFAVHLQDFPVLKSAMQKLLAGEEVVCEYRIRRKSSKTYTWLEDRMIPKRNADNTIHQIFCSARDITKRKAAYDEREKLINALNDKYNELMQFNYIVSHNLRAPVAGMLGAVNLLQTGLGKEDTAHVYTLLQESAGTLDSILRDLNVILSAKSGLNEKFEVASVSEIIADIQALLELQIRSTKAIIRVSIDPKAERLRTIKSYLQSILYNLISNAIKYREIGATPIIDIAISKKQKAYILQVSDNGIGIDLKKYGSKLYGIYQRFNTEYEGKGLGLHMTKIQTEALGGKIEVKSTVGVGTTFTITLP